MASCLERRFCLGLVTCTYFTPEISYEAISIKSYECAPAVAWIPDSENCPESRREFDFQMMSKDATGGVKRKIVSKTAPKKELYASLCYCPSNGTTYHLSRILRPCPSALSAYSHAIIAVQSHPPGY